VNSVVALNATDLCRDVSRTDVLDEEDAVEPTSGVTLRRELGQSAAADERPTSIAERLSQLYESQESWKSKVEESDAVQFTVEGKMNRLGQSRVVVTVDVNTFLTFFFIFPTFSVNKNTSTAVTCQLANYALETF